MTIEYLTVTELSHRIKYSEQTIYNLICGGTFIEGRHYFKPTPKKILFKWQEIIMWVEGDTNNASRNDDSIKPELIVGSRPESKTPCSSITI